MEKTFTLVIKVLPNNTPQNWKFENGVSGIEQIAIWTIVSKLAQQEANKLLNSGK